MSGIAAQIATTVGVVPGVTPADPLGVTDSPSYFQVAADLGVAPSGTVAASATLGNVTLGTALDAVYGPTNNNCPGIWLYLPATALAAPYNVAGWYWCVMSSTTVGTVYGVSPLNGGVSQNAISSTQLGSANPFSPGSQVGYSYCWAPPTVVSTQIATGSGAGYTGVTTAVPGPVFQLQGSTVTATGSLSFSAAVSATNSAGAKTVRAVVASNALLTTGAVTVGTQALTTGVSVNSLLGQLFMNGSVTNSWRYISGTGGAVPGFGSLDMSLTQYVGHTFQLATATDWVIAHLTNITVSQS